MVSATPAMTSVKVHSHVSGQDSWREAATAAGLPAVEGRSADGRGSELVFVMSRNECARISAPAASRRAAVSSSPAWRQSFWGFR